METTPKSPTQPIKDKSKRPKWLRKLEQESWQAELIISGLAIYGSLQIPQYIDRTAEWALTFFQPEFYEFFYFFFWFLVLAAMTLITSFLVHFVMRTIWVGLVGFNSIFPEGIKKNGEYYSKYFIEKASEEFPNGKLDIAKYDNHCSGIFASATVLCLTMFGSSLLIIIILGIKYLLSLFLPLNVAQVIFYCILGLLFLFWLAMSSLNMKRFHENEKLQHWLFKASKVYQKISFNPFQEVTNYVSLTSFSNEGFKLKSGIGPMLLILLMGGSMFHLVNSKIIYFFTPNPFEKIYARTDFTEKSCYENNLYQLDERILSAVIESERIEGNSMKIFVPIFGNEEPIYEGLCGEFEKNEDLSRDENRILKRAHYFDCYHEYHRFYVNGHLYDTELMKYDHPNRGEYGVLTYLPTDNFKVGKNTLRIEKLEDKEGKVYRTMRIGFWYLK